MNIFKSIITAEHTFAAWAEKELAKAFSEAPKIAQVTTTVLKYVGPALQVIVSAEAGPAAGAEVGKVVSEIQSDLTAVAGLVYDFGATPSVGSILNAASNNLASLLSLGHISNPVAVGAAKKVVGELAALAAAFPAATPAPATSAAEIATPVAQTAAVAPAQAVSLTK